MQHDHDDAVPTEVQRAEDLRQEIKRTTAIVGVRIPSHLMPIKDARDEGRRWRLFKTYPQEKGDEYLFVEQVPDGVVARGTLTSEEGIQFDVVVYDKPYTIYPRPSRRKVR